MTLDALRKYLHTGAGAMAGEVACYQSRSRIHQVNGLKDKMAINSIVFDFWRRFGSLIHAGYGCSDWNHCRSDDVGVVMPSVADLSIL